MKTKTTIFLSALLLVAAVFGMCASLSADNAESEPPKSDFETAVEIIKKYETLHQPRHWPLVGYGHKVLPGEKFSRTKAMSEADADALLRKDLLKNCAVFREYGADSLLLGVLAYNIGSGAVKKSSVARKLKAGDRNIRDNYISHCRYRGKEHAQIKRRRIEEFEALFDRPAYPSASVVSSAETVSKSPTTAALSSLLPGGKKNKQHFLLNVRPLHNNA